MVNGDTVEAVWWFGNDFATPQAAVYVARTQPPSRNSTTREDGRGGGRQKTEGFVLIIAHAVFFFIVVMAIHRSWPLCHAGDWEQMRVMGV
jgi:hypothetical protein